MLVELDKVYIDITSTEDNPLELLKEAYFKSRDEIGRLYPNSKSKVSKLKLGKDVSFLKDITAEQLSNFKAIDDIKNLFLNIEVDSKEYHGLSFVWEVETPIVLGSRYFHISNGGLSVEILETSYGPRLSFRQSFLGATSSVMNTLIEKEVIGQLADFFGELRDFNFGSSYCNAAEAAKIP